MSWSVSGSYVEACNCDVLCPCVFLQPPSSGECTALVGWHVEQGHHDDTDLAGLNVALALHSPGPMTEVPWRVALYLDERAAPAQAEALTTIFSGAGGGHPAVLGSHIGEVLGVASAPISFSSDDGARSLKIGEVGHLRVVALAGADGGHVTVSNHPLAIAPGNPATVARTEGARFDDHDHHWELSEKNGLFSPFSYAA